MKIPRMSMITLGVADLQRATAFYAQVLGTPPNTSFGGVTFIQLPGVWISLYPFSELARDIGPDFSASRTGFSGISLAHNARSAADVRAILANAAAAGGTILKPAQDTFWGGYSGYFSDPDGHIWEIAWGPGFSFSEHGDLQFSDTADNAAITQQSNTQT